MPGVRNSFATFSTNSRRRRRRKRRRGLNPETDIQGLRENDPHGNIHLAPGETPLVAASREVQEETGFEPKRLEEIGQVLTNPGISDEIAHLFYAEVDARKTGHVSGVEKEGEEILVTAIPAQEAFAMLDKWEIQKATSLVVLNWLRMNRGNLR